MSPDAGKEEKRWRTARVSSDAGREGLEEVGDS